MSIARVCVILAVLSAVALAARVRHTQVDELENYTFDDFVSEYKRPHLLGAAYKGNTQEYTLRKAIFEKNMAMIKKHNADPKNTYFMNINQFGDLTQEEFVKQWTGYNKGMSRTGRRATLKKAVNLPEMPKVYQRSQVPDAIDWRQKGVVTPVKNQGQCGSCWAFAATAVYESHAAITTGKLELLSTQQATSCTPNPKHCGGTGGCQGATCELAFDYWSKAGVTTNDIYPYTSGSSGATGSCKYNTTGMKPVFNNKGFVQLPENDLDAHLQAVSTKGPLGISVAASDWMFYGGGIFNGCSFDKSIDVNHAVVLDGYGADGDKKYWIVRNSWGSSWGEKGYIRLLRRDVEQCGTDKTPDHGVECEGGRKEVTVCGTCGMLLDTSYPSDITLA